jgi:hypothetical protein
MSGSVVATTDGAGEGATPLLTLDGYHGDLDALLTLARAGAPGSKLIIDCSGCVSDYAAWRAVLNKAVADPYGMRREVVEERIER